MQIAWVVGVSTLLSVNRHRDIMLNEYVPQILDKVHAVTFLMAYFNQASHDRFFETIH